MTTIPDDVTDLAHQYVKHAEELCRELKLFLGTGNALDVLDRVVAKAILAAEKRGEERERAKLNAIIDMWKRRDHLSLHSGEVTAQEFRTVVAVLNAIAAAIRKGSD